MMMRLNIKTDNYGKFIEQIRDKARNPKRFSHNRPVLPDQPKDPLKAECFDIELQADDAVAVVRIRRFDLYVIGFRTQNGKWFEFKRPEKENPKIKLIQGSQYLPFDENYNNLGELKSLCKDGLGYEKLKGAIKTLADSEKNEKEFEKNEKRKSALMIVIVMLSESTRFVTLSTPFAIAMHNQKRPAEFKVWMPTLINSWGDLSKWLLLANKKSDEKGYKFEIPKNTTIMKNDDEKIQSAVDAADCLGILKSTAVADLVPKPRLLTSFAAAKNTNTDFNIQGHGQPLVEVFSIRMNGSQKLYGTIQVTDGLGSMYLYNRAQNDPESIRPNDTASLTGPDRAVSLCQIFTLSLDLKDQDKSKEEVSNGSFTWSTFLLSTTPDAYYNRRLFKTVKGKYGSATVYCTMFRTALQAKVDIVLINADHGKNPVNVYGNMVARYSNYDYSTAEQKKYFQTSLFNKLSNKPAIVNPGKSIPLSRFIVAVPTTTASTNLVVEADLSSGKYAKGTAIFMPQIEGSFVNDIKGSNGSIQITVTWSRVSQ